MFIKIQGDKVSDTTLYYTAGKSEQDPECHIGTYFSLILFNPSKKIMVLDVPL